MSDFDDFDDDVNEHDLYNMEDGQDWQSDEFFYSEMNTDICNRELNSNDSDKEFWDRELHREWV